MKKVYSLLPLLLMSLSIWGCSSGGNEIEKGNEEGNSDKNIPLTIDYTRPLTDNNKVIYELNLYDFTNAGTLQAATQKLDELNKLGIDIVWLMPIHDRGDIGKIGSLGSPYAAKDYYSVNPDFGSLDDLISFVATAHAKNMKVLLDWVPNHTAMDAVWVKEHPEYYTQKNGVIVHPNNYGDVYQLNMNSEQAQNAMIQAMEYWIKEADIDGYRCDYISSSAIPASFWTKAIPALKSIKSDLIMLGEADFMDAKRLFNCGFNYDYAWQFHNRLKDFGTSADAATLKKAAQELVDNSNYSQMDRMVYLTNHDDNENNFSSNYIQYMGNNRYPLTVLEFTLYGMPLLYNGQENGYTKVMNYFEREPINWNEVDAKMNNTVRSLIALRHTSKALSSGIAENRAKVEFLTVSHPNVLAYKKVKEGEEVLVVLNLGGQSVQATIDGITSGTYTQWIDSRTIRSSTDGKQINLSTSSKMSLESKGYAVFVLK